jgi:hypothetical protein
MSLVTSELALVVLAGLASGTYAKSEGASSLLAAVIGVLAAVLIVVITR